MDWVEINRDMMERSKTGGRGYTVGELREIAKDLNLTSSGVKSVVAERILSYVKTASTTEKKGKFKVKPQKITTTKKKTASPKREASPKKRTSSPKRKTSPARRPASPKRAASPKRPASPRRKTSPARRKSTPPKAEPKLPPIPSSPKRRAAVLPPRPRPLEVDYSRPPTRPPTRVALPITPGAMTVVSKTPPQPVSPRSVPKPSVRPLPKPGAGVVKSSLKPQVRPLPKPNAKQAARPFRPLPQPGPPTLKRDCDNYEEKLTPAQRANLELILDDIHKDRRNAPDKEFALKTLCTTGVNLDYLKTKPGQVRDMLVSIYSLYNGEPIIETNWAPQLRLADNTSDYAEKIVSILRR